MCAEQHRRLRAVVAKRSARIWRAQKDSPGSGSNSVFAATSSVGPGAPSGPIRPTVTGAGTVVATVPDSTNGIPSVGSPSATSNTAPGSIRILNLSNNAGADGTSAADPEAINVNVTPTGRPDSPGDGVASCATVLRWRPTPTTPTMKRTMTTTSTRFRRMMSPPMDDPSRVRAEPLPVCRRDVGRQRKSNPLPFAVGIERWGDIPANHRHQGIAGSVIHLRELGQYRRRAEHR